jgi:hypothetical protein
MAGYRERVLCEALNSSSTQDRPGCHHFPSVL